MYYRRYDFEITKREVLFSVIIFFVMLIIGVVSNSALMTILFKRMICMERH